MAAAERTVQVGQWYKHYKGSIYQVIALGFWEEDKTPVVVYKHRTSDTVWVRKTTAFLSMAPDEDGVFPRFELVPAEELTGDGLRVS